MFNNCSVRTTFLFSRGLEILKICGTWLFDIKNPAFSRPSFSYFSQFPYTPAEYTL